MAISPARRRRINRQNSRRSTGPGSEAGKRVVSTNSVKHRMCSKSLQLPGEDPDVLARRRAAWDVYYPSDDPAAEHLRVECFRATLMSQRCDRQYDGLLAQQVRSAEDHWDFDREAEVQSLITHLTIDPGAAIRGLHASSDGCT